MNKQSHSLHEQEVELVRNLSNAALTGSLEWHIVFYHASIACVCVCVLADRGPCAVST
jgi:hypothetical protein